MMRRPGIAGGRAAVLGAGRQGVCAAYDLACFGGASEIVVADASADALVQARTRLEQLLPGFAVATRTLDADDEVSLASALAGSVTGVCALPYRFGPAAARAAVRARCSLVDLGGNTEVSRQILAIGDDAASAGVCLVPDTGLAPGLATSLAAAGIGRLGRAREVRIWCGGLPVEFVPPLGYRLVFNIEGLFNEYSGDAVYLRGGRIVRVPALSEIERVELPGVGPLEAFPTSGGTSTAPDSFLGQLELYEYRTVRYPGHRDRFRALADLGLLSDEPVCLDSTISVRPRDLLARLLTSLLDRPQVPDLVVLRVEVRGELDGRSTGLTFDLLDRQDDATGFTAMERCTAHPAATVAEMAAAGEIEPGARRLETQVPPEPFLTRFARRPLRLSSAAAASADVTRGAKEDR